MLNFLRCAVTEGQEIYLHCVAQLLLILIIVAVSNPNLRGDAQLYGSFSKQSNQAANEHRTNYLVPFS